MLPSVLLSMVLAFVSPEVGFGSQTPGPGIAQGQPAVGFDGTNYLVVWHDHRSGDTGHVFARLVSKAGVPVGEEFLLLDQAEHKDATTVLFDGTNFVVALRWAGFPAVVRVSRSGTVLDPGGIVIGTTMDGVPRMAFDGTNHLLVWSDERGPYNQIYAARVARDGRVLDPGGRLVSSNLTEPAWDPDVVFDGTDFVVAWVEDGALVSTRVATDATVVAPGPTLFFNPALELLSSPRLAAKAGGAVAAFLERASDTDSEPRLIDVQAGATPAVLSTRHAHDAPMVALDGSQFVSLWSDEDDCRLYAARTSAALVPLDGDGVVLFGGMESHHAQAAFAADRSGGGLLSFTVSGFDNGVAFATLSPATLATSPFAPVSRSARDQSQPSLAALGNGAITAFIESDSTARNVVLGLVAPAGTPSSLEVTSGEGDRRPSAMASNGTDRALVVWRGNGRLMGRLSDASGAALTPETTLCDDPNTDNETPAVAWDGAQFVVAFRQWANSMVSVRLMRVTAAGAPVATCGVEVTQFDPSRWYFFNLAVGATNGTALVVWELKDETDYSKYLFFRRESGGVFSDGAPVSLSSDEGATEPVVQAVGASFVVAWAGARLWNADLFGATVPASGAASAPVVLTSLQSNERSPALAFDGSRLLLAWEDFRRGRPDVYARFLQPDLTGLAPEFAVAVSPGEDESPRLVALSPGRFAVSHTFFDMSPGMNARRVALRWITDLAQASGCSADLECQSGFCVDGVCCDGACGGGAADCQACSTAKGASADGVCSVVPAMTECRGAASECDVAEFCDGAARTCPADQQRPDGLSCSAGGVCDHGACLTGAAPKFTSAVSVQLTCGQRWSYSKAGRPQVAGDGPFTFSARTADGAPLPAGFTIDAATGELGWQTDQTQAGSVLLELKVESPAGADTQLIELVVDCSRRITSVSCSQTGGEAMALSLLAWALSRRRRR